MAYHEALAERIREVSVDSADVSERKMFGGLAFLVRGHMVCGVTHDDSCSAWAPEGRPPRSPGRTCDRWTSPAVP